MNFKHTRAGLAGALVALLLLLPVTAVAHEEIEVGSYVLEYGWFNEPVLVGLPNALYLFITAKEEGESGEISGEEGEEHHAAEGVTGAGATLEFAVEYGGARQTYDLLPVLDQPGLYRADFIPTRRGQYTYIFTGEINGEPVDVSVEPEEVAEAGRLAFPEPMLTSADITAQLDEAEARANTAQAVAMAGVALGVVGAGLGGYALLKPRRG